MKFMTPMKFTSTIYSISLSEILFMVLNDVAPALGITIWIGPKALFALDLNARTSVRSDTSHAMEMASPPEMRTRLRGILGAFMFSGEDADKKVSVLSGGERARLALACLLLRPFNLLVLDEPTNHLDMLSKDVLKKAIQDYDGTLIVVSHDREFLSGLTNRTIEFRDHQLYDYIGDVNAFLEKRQLDNMREVELSTKSAKAGGGAAPRKELSFEERKLLMRAVSNAEKKVQRLEEEIDTLEKKMAQPGFYESEDAVKTTQRYQDKQKLLETAMDEWEEAQMAVEEYED